MPAFERSLGTVRPDVSARINGIPVAIEVQLSVLSLETIARRTAEYAKKGVYVFWLTQWTLFLDADRYSPEALGEPPQFLRARFNRTTPVKPRISGQDWTSVHYHSFFYDEPLPFSMRRICTPTSYAN
jgi:hypothetical protein